MSHFSGTVTPLEAPPPLLTLGEAADLARVSTLTVRRWANSGRLPSRRLPGPNGKILIPRQAIDELLGGEVSS